MRFEWISEQPGEPGAKSRIAFRVGKGGLEMVETITEEDPPDRFGGTYETKGAYHAVRHRFQAREVG